MRLYIYHLSQPTTIINPLPDSVICRIVPSLRFLMLNLVTSNAETESMANAIHRD